MARTRTKKEFSVRDLIAIAIFTAFICLVSPIKLGTGPTVSITLATFTVCLTAAVLGFKRGLVCIIIYLVLGALGVPVFADWTGGYEHFLENSAGYLVGLLLLMMVAGLIIDANERNSYIYFVGMIAGVALCYLLGALWLVVKSQLAFTALWDTGFVPYLSAECIKIFVAAMLGYPLRKLVKKITG